MFEQLENLLHTGSYLAAGRILTPIGRMTLPSPKPAPEGFKNAQVRVIPMNDVLHVFVSVDRLKDFYDLPGAVPCVEDMGTVDLHSKWMHLAETDSERYARGVMLHFLHAESK